MKVTFGDRLIISLAVLAFFFSFWYVSVSLGQQNGVKQVKVWQAEKLIYSGSLEQQRQLRVGGCVISIKKGTVRVLKSTCPKKLCVKQGSIQYVNQSLVCLPHKVVITIVAPQQEKAAVDAVLR
jgi:hypothetical protein